MRALRFHDYRGFDSLSLDEIAVPDPRPGELLVRVHAAGINPFDRYAIEGYVNAFVRFELPATLGRDFSGAIVAVGEGVGDFAPGDLVFGHAAADADGSFADFIRVPAVRVAPKPDQLSHVEAASLPNVLMAAWDGLFSTQTGADLQPGQTLLVNGAAGGIGSVAVQLARWKGARVIGTASAPNLDLVTAMGASAHDYADNGWYADVAGLDAVIDTSAGSDADRLCGLLRAGGVYVAMRGLPSGDFAERWLARGVICRVASGPASENAFGAMADAVAQGAVKPIVTRVYPLERYRHALEAIGGGHARGKTVLLIAAEEEAG